MDIFSLGYDYIAMLCFGHICSCKPTFINMPCHVLANSCVIAEMFLEGSSIFSLSQLFKYKSGDYSPYEQLEKIEDADIRVGKQHQSLGEISSCDSL